MIFLLKLGLKQCNIFLYKRLDSLIKFFELCHLKEVFVVFFACQIMDKKLKNIEIMKTVVVHLALTLSLTLLGNYIDSLLGIISSVVDPVGVEGGFSNEIS